MENKIYTSKDYTTEELICDCYNFKKYMEPFWKGNIVYNEVVFPITDTEGNAEPLSLLYDPTEIVSVRNYTLDEKYEEGRDYILEDGILKVVPGGKIQVIDYWYMHPADNPDNLPTEVRYPHWDGNGFEYWDESPEIAKYCVCVTYIHNDTWHSVTPPSIRKDIPKTCQKLKDKERFTCVVVGDSVSAGAMSSFCARISPFADAYPELLWKHMQDKYDLKIDLENKAIGGTKADLTEEMVKERIIKYKPSLVIIAYGMNDSSYQVHSETGNLFERDITQDIEFIRKELPETEIILVASVYGNTETFHADVYEDLAGRLHKIAAKYEGVAICDPQEIQRPLINSGRKKFLDFMADNMVHPNDFGMRLIAQTIAEAIVEE